MTRMMPKDVINAYNITGMVPIRLAWTTKNSRGACAIDALAQHRGITRAELCDQFPDGYEDGFICAWDTDESRRKYFINKIREENDLMIMKGFCDGLRCRAAIENIYSSGLIPIVKRKSKDS
jgi:hypothetical protein